MFLGGMVSTMVGHDWVIREEEVNGRRSQSLAARGCRGKKGAKHIKPVTRRCSLKKRSEIER